MGDLGSDYEASIGLIIDEYRRLEMHDNQHELLQYITNVNDEGFERVADKQKAFLDRFETPEDKKSDYVRVVKVLASYFVALRNAVDEIEGIDRSPKQYVSETPRKTLDDVFDLDDDLPF